LETIKLTKLQVQWRKEIHASIIQNLTDETDEDLA